MFRCLLKKNKKNNKINTHREGKKMVVFTLCLHLGASELKLSNVHALVFSFAFFLSNTKATSMEFISFCNISSKYQQ